MFVWSQLFQTLMFTHSFHYQSLYMISQLSSICKPHRKGLWSSSCLCKEEAFCFRHVNAISVDIFRLLRLYWSLEVNPSPSVAPGSQESSGSWLSIPCCTLGDLLYQGVWFGSSQTCEAAEHILTLGTGETCCAGASVSARLAGLGSLLHKSGASFPGAEPGTSVYCITVSGQLPKFELSS